MDNDIYDLLPECRGFKVSQRGVFRNKVRGGKTGTLGGGGIMTVWGEGRIKLTLIYFLPPPQITEMSKLIWGGTSIFIQVELESFLNKSNSFF